MILWSHQTNILLELQKQKYFKEEIIMKKKAARTMAGILTLSMAAALTACGGEFRPDYRADTFRYAL